MVIATCDKHVNIVSWRLEKYMVEVKRTQLNIAVGGWLISSCLDRCWLEHFAWLIYFYLVSYWSNLTSWLHSKARVLQNSKVAEKRTTFTLAMNEEAIRQRLCNSKVFSWGGYHKNDVVRHTGVLLWFDGKPSFALDFGPKVFNIQCLVTGCNATVAINVPSKNGTYCGDLQRICTRSEQCKCLAWGTIKELLQPPSDTYLALDIDCRDHLFQAVRLVCRNGRCNPNVQESTERAIISNRNTDLNYIFVGSILLAVLALFLFAYAARR